MQPKSSLEKQTKSFLKRYNKDNIPTGNSSAEEYWEKYPYIQYQWGYIDDSDTSTPKAYDLIPTRFCYLFRKAHIEYMLQNNETPKNHQILTVIRGHQHHGNMLKRLKVSKGYVRHWNGLFNTIISSPDLTGYSTFLIIQLNSDPNQWSVSHYAKPKNRPTDSLKLISKNKLLEEKL